MKFTEIFDKFKSHSYIRRESWSEDTFIQLRSSVNLIRLIKFEEIPNDLTTIHGKACELANQRAQRIVLLDNDIRLTAEDLLADDWIDIEDLMPKKKETIKTFWDYVDTLKDGSDDWRYVIQLGQKYI